MLKFKRLNIQSLAKEGVKIYSVDLLRQSSIEFFVKLLNEKHKTKDEAIEILMNNISILLNQMIKEEKL